MIVILSVDFNKGRGDVFSDGVWCGKIKGVYDPKVNCRVERYERQRAQDISRYGFHSMKVR